MAETSFDPTDDDSRFDQVIFQRNKVVIDGELNEIGRLDRVRSMRLHRMATQNTGEGAFHGRAMCVNIEIVAGPNPDEVTIQAITGKIGMIAVRGYIVRLVTPVVVSGIEITPILAEEYQIYIQFTEVEVGALDDPTIQVNALQETARRQRINASILLGAVNVDSATAAHTVAEAYESSAGSKVGLLATVRRDSGISEDVFQYQIYTAYIPAPDFDLFRMSTWFFARRVQNDRAFASWSSALNTLTTSNIAVVVAGTWAEENIEPLKIVLPETVELANDGDALVLHIPPWRRNTFAIDIGYTYASLTPDMEQLLATVENFDNYSRGFVDIADLEEGFSGRFVVAVRTRSNEILFRNGIVVRSDSHIQSLPGEGEVEIVLDNGCIETHQKGLTTSDTNDMIPYVHSRYIGDSMYNLLSAFVEKTVLGVQVFTRIYTANQDGASGLVITHNARWMADVPVWKADEKTVNSFIFRLGSYTLLSANEAQITFGQKIGIVADTWDDDAWDLDGTGTKNAFAHLIINPYGNVQMPDTAGSKVTGIRSVEYSGSGDPTVSQAFNSPNAQGAINTCKAWCAFRCNAGVITLYDGLGITSIAVVGTNLRVTLMNAYTSIYYCPVVNGRKSTGLIQAQPSIISTSVFDIEGATAAGVAIDFSAAGDYRIHFHVQGRQV